MNTETLTIHQKGEDFEIIVQHDQSGSAYGMSLSKDAYEQLRQHFVVGRSESYRAMASKMKILEVLEYYEKSEPRDVPTGVSFTFKNRKGDYLEIIVFDEGREIRYIDDNYPFPRKIHMTNIPVRSTAEFESDLNRMGIEIPSRKPSVG